MNYFRTWPFKCSHHIWHFSMPFYSFSLGSLIHVHSFNYHLQNPSPNQSVTLTSLLNFSLNCPNVSWTSVHGCSAVISNLTCWTLICLPIPFQISLLTCIFLYYIPSLIININLQFSFFLFQGYTFFSSFSEFSCLALFVWRVAGIPSLFLHPPGWKHGWIVPFTYKSSYRYYYLFLIYWCMLASVFLSLSLHFLPRNTVSQYYWNCSKMTVGGKLCVCVCLSVCLYTLYL